MSIKLKDINAINYINFTMKEINECTDNIYEAMMDSEFTDIKQK